jgi:hypothetical protein
VPAKNDESWTAGEIVVQRAASGDMKKADADNIITIGSGIVAFDKPTTDNMGTVYFAPAIVYSKYVPAAALKNLTPVATILATPGAWGGGTDANAFAQLLGKQGQGMGSGQGFNDYTDVAQNDICRLRLIR